MTIQVYTMNYLIHEIKCYTEEEVQTVADYWMELGYKVHIV